MNYILGLAGSKNHVGESLRAHAPVTSLTSDLRRKSTSSIDPEQGSQSSLVTLQATMPTGSRSFARTSPAGHRANGLGVGDITPCTPQATMPTSARGQVLPI